MSFLSGVTALAFSARRAISLLILYGEYPIAKNRYTSHSPPRMNGLLLLILRVLSVMRQEIRFSRKLIMSAISDYAVKQKAFNERQAAAVDAAVASLGGLTADIQVLNDKITELQNSSGGVTPEDQALIDDLQTQGEAVAAKGEALAAALATLDSQTPPAVPPTP